VRICTEKPEYLAYILLDVARWRPIFWERPIDPAIGIDALILR
jgi:hypothetical protein